MKYKGIVIGCGLIGAQLEKETDRPKPASHAGSLSSNERTELVGLVEANPEVLATALELFPQARGYATLESCLENEIPDIAVVATPPSSHLSIIQVLVEKNISMIICEKPLADTFESAQKIVELVKERVCVINYQRRFFLLIADAKEKIASGILGRVQNITCRYSNGLFNNGGHCIDTVRFLTGDEITEAKAFIDRLNQNHPQGDMNATVLLKTAGGIPVTLQSFDQTKFGVNDIEIYGEKGALMIGEYGYRVSMVPLGPSLFSGVSELSYDNARVQSDRRSMVADVLNQAIDVLEGAENKSSASSAARTMEVLGLIAKNAE